jgi:hypothetical protein
MLEGIIAYEVFDSVILDVHQPAFDIQRELFVLFPG